MRLLWPVCTSQWKKGGWEKEGEDVALIQRCIIMRYTLSLYPLEDIASSEDAVQAAKRDLETAQEEHNKTSTTLKSLLDSAMNLGLQSKVEQMEEKIAKVASELLAGADEAESNSKMLEQYQEEAQRTREELQR